MPCFDFTQHKLRMMWYFDFAQYKCLPEWAIWRAIVLRILRTRLSVSRLAVKASSGHGVGLLYYKMVLHLREDEVGIETDGIYAEGFGACILDGGSNMPELVIEDEPTVVLLVCPLLDVEWFAGVLGVVLQHECAEGWSDSGGVDGGWYAIGSCIEEVDGLGTDVAVNEDDACGGLADE